MIQKQRHCRIINHRRPFHSVESPCHKTREQTLSCSFRFVRTAVRNLVLPPAVLYFRLIRSGFYFLRIAPMGRHDWSSQSRHGGVGSIRQSAHVFRRRPFCMSCAMSSGHISDNTSNGADDRLPSSGCLRHPTTTAQIRRDIELSKSVTLPPCFLPISVAECERGIFGWMT